MDNQQKGLKLILEEALKVEEKAEDNCEMILHEARINGFHNAIEHIENDERKHQEMVKKLLSFLD
ncbi:MAG: hypothetical protein WC551_04415 [Patescibacteria group bacterium]